MRPSPLDPKRNIGPGIAATAIERLARYPKTALLCGLLLAMSALTGLARLQADFSYAGYFHKDDAWLQEFDEFERVFGNDDSIIVAVETPGGLFNPDSIALLHELTERLWQLPDVIRVDTLTNYQHVFAEGDEIIVAPLIAPDAALTAEYLQDRKDVALSHETLPGYLVSPDGTMTMLFGTLRPAGDAPPDAAEVANAARALIASIDAKGHELHLVGAPMIVASFAEIAAADNARIIPLLLLCVTLLMYAVLRSVWCVAYGVAIVVLSAVSVLGLAGWLGVQMTSITTVLPQIMIGVAVADCLHILSTYRLVQRDIPERREAALYALKKNALPTLLTTLTTAIGFLGFTLSDIKTIADLGLAAAAGVILAWALSYLLLGPALLLLPFGGPRAGEPMRLAPGAARAMVAALGRYRRPVLAGFAAFALLGVYAGTRVQVDADPVAYFSQGHELRDGVEAIDAGIGSARNIEIMIDAGCADCAKAPDFLRRVDTFERWIEGREDVVQVISIVDLLKASRRALQGGAREEYRLADSQSEIAQELLFYTMGLPQGLSVNNRIATANDAVRLTVMWRVSSSSRALTEIAAIETRAAVLGLDATVTGKYALYQRQESYVVASFLSSVGLALLLICAVLALAFGSLRLGALALLPNLTPLLVGGLGLWALGANLNVGTVLVVSITLGIAVDDTVHILAEYRRLRRNGQGAAAAFEGVFSETGIALASTTLVLMAAFGVSILASFAPYQVFGVLAAAVLLVALIVDCALLPALLLRGESGRRAPKLRLFARSPGAR
ncbi:MMPL family transporter [Marivita sp. GX14005]|uniref:efflux RND transporter permease subunit n=1 Tax=Marivita sp. GX14005 TaxID=2942276 RepID=UPI0020184F4E|nr:MMPL family transporter [Marivita sp. GX14005]MCL3883033.1 MMPL family transporter [Marivita sp. GX14005]